MAEQHAASYAGVALVCPVTVAYRKRADAGAAWFLGSALRELLAASGLPKAAVDGLAVSSATLAPDTVVALTEHFELSPRYLDHQVSGGAAGVMAMRRAARAVQAGDARVIACLAGDTCRPESFRELVAAFSSFSMDAVHPYAAAGPNGVFAMITERYMREHGAQREDFGQLCVAQRYNAMANPNALLRKPLALEDYLEARPIAPPLHLFDCVLPCAGGHGFLVMSTDDAKGLDLPYVVILAAEERHNAFFEDETQLRGGWASYAGALFARASLAPAELQFLQCYDDYPVIVLEQLEDLGFCAKGEAPRFVRENPLTYDGGGLAVNTSGGQLSAGQAGFAGGFLGLVEALEQLLGLAGERQIADARAGLVSGYGMVTYDHCLCTSAAILARGQP